MIFWTRITWDKRKNSWMWEKRNYLTDFSGLCILHIYIYLDRVYNIVNVYVFSSTENPRESANKRSARHVWHVRLGTQRRNRDEGKETDLGPLFSSPLRVIFVVLRSIYNMLYYVCVYVISIARYIYYYFFWKNNDKDDDRRCKSLYGAFKSSQSATKKKKTKNILQLLYPLEK